MLVIGYKMIEHTEELVESSQNTPFHIFPTPKDFASKKINNSNCLVVLFHEGIKTIECKSNNSISRVSYNFFGGGNMIRGFSTSHEKTKEKL